MYLALLALLSSLLLFSCTPALSAPVSEKTVNVAMSATWPATPLLVETAEHIASVDAAHYWSFLSALSAHLTSLPTQPSTEAQWYEVCVSVAGGLLGGASMEILRTALALHTHTVKAQLYHTLLLDTAVVYGSSIEQCTDTGSVVQYNGRLGCDVASVLDTSADSRERVYEFDHIYPSAIAATNRTLILYADLGRLFQSSAHSELVQLARRGQIQYVLRPKFAHASSAALQLQGWGVELAIKNMEYKVLDDTRLHAHDVDDGQAVVTGATLWSRLRIEDAAVIAELAEFQAEYAANAEDEKILVKDNTDYVLSDIALQASQVILHSADPLQALYELTGQFPAYASALTKVQVNSTVRSGTERKGIQPGSNLISLHGQALSVDDLDVYALLALLQSHSSLIDYFASLHLSPASTRQLLSASSATPSDEQDATLTMYGGGSDPNAYLVKMDTSDPAISDTVVLWMNDMTRDRRYAQWPSSVREFLQPAWGQQLKYVRQNIYTGVAVADVSTQRGLELLHNLWQFVKGNAPMQVGLVVQVGDAQGGEAGEVQSWDSSLGSEDEYRKVIGAATDDSAGGASNAAVASIQSLLARMVHHLKLHGNADDAWDFLDALYQEGADITDDVAWDVFGQFDADADDKARRRELLANADASAYIAASASYLTQRGFTAAMLPTLVVHNQPHPYRAEHGADFRSYLMELVFNEQRKAGLRVYLNVFRDRMDFADYWNTRSNVYAKLAPHILKPAEQRTFASSLLPTRPPSDAAPKLAYLTSLDPEREFAVKGVTCWVVADWDSLDGLRLAQAALDHLDNSATQYQSRVAFIFNPSSSATIVSSFASRLASAIVHSYSLSQSLPLLRKLASLSAWVLARNPSKLQAALAHLIEHTPKLSKVASALSMDSSTLNKGGGLNPAVPADYVREVLQLGAGEQAVVANGYVVLPPANASAASLLSDFSVLDAYVHSTLLAGNIRPLVESFSFPGLDSDDLTSDWYSDIVLQACYALNRRTQQAGAQHSRMAHVQWPSVLDATEDEAVVQWSAGPAAWMELKVLLNPLSKEAQQLAGVLLALRQSFNLSIQLFLNPAREVTQLPLKRFYHYAVDTQLHFDDAGAVVPFPGAIFRHLQTRAVLTLTIDTPEPWLVGLKVAPYDSDNLRLDVLPASVQLLSVEYALEHLLINGQCFDQTSRPPQPPSGLQLLLSSPSVPYAGDTVVMQNLGYFQLKANPGVWTLSFAGRHASIYELHPTLNERQDASQLSTAELSVVSLTDPYKRIFVQRVEGQEDAQLLEVTRDKHTGLFSSLFHRRAQADADADAAAAASSTELTATEAEDADTIHIFSLASGHLYERFLKIMMLSVIQHTTARVKFWFIRNFASPQFVSFVPAMAAHYGFSVEFITYKWPVWLRRQTEKQRVIWGYKILFLDVLWPLRIPRVIYIDADQVVRGDVRELWDMDLKGNAYAYTPFCDSNDATKGFRFWDSGYWRDHLRGKPYHISALYVVDLQIFRAMRAGDSLRSIYDNLSADPNSLANLDQDLPNYAQHMVPILSLPMEWLWCQTWCSMDSLPDAKTIDLCNNPLTKTPKLDVARQLLPEWTGLDAQARELEAKLLEGGGGNVNATGGYGVGAGSGRGSEGRASKVEEYTHVAGVKGGSGDGPHDEL